MRRPVALLLGAAAFAATLAPQASANPFCTIGPVRAFGPVCTVKCLIDLRPAGDPARVPGTPNTSSTSCLWED